MDQLEAAVVAEGIAPRRLFSGAGHDAMALRQIADIGMLFVRCTGGISHNPAEAITAEGCRHRRPGAVAFHQGRSTLRCEGRPPAEAASVDHQQAAEDAGRAGPLADGRPLAEQGHAEGERADRDHQRDQHQVGRPGAGQDPEVDHVGRRGTENRHAHQTAAQVVAPGARVQGRSMTSARGRISSVDAVNWPPATTTGGRPAKRRPNTAAQA